MFEGLEEVDYAGERGAGAEMLLLARGDFDEVFFGGYGELGPVEEDFAGLESKAEGKVLVWGMCMMMMMMMRRREEKRGVRTVGPGRPWSWALMCHGRLGLPYSLRTSLVHMVYLSSESIKRPSMSKRHALMVGSLMICGSAVVSEDATP